MYEYLFAVALLLTPPTEADYTQYDTPFMRRAIASVAVQFQILDKQEVKNDDFFAPRYRGHCSEAYRLDAFSQAIVDLQQRRQQLQAAPFIEESMRFPPRNVIDDMLAFNRKYMEWLKNFHAIAPAWKKREIDVVISETEQLYQVWFKLREAQNGIYYVQVRRQMFSELRDLVGMRAFYSGELPPHVPIWRFESR